MRQIFTIIFSFTAFFASAQTVATFENIALPPNSFLNGSNGDEAATSGNVRLAYGYSFDFNCCALWAISNKTDAVTPGFGNQFSAKTGSGFDGSANYAISSGAETTLAFLEPVRLRGFYITNNTYAYYSMRDGDSFAKRFGGETGNDPDFLKLTIFSYVDGALGTDSVEFYLADYRFSDNTKDYILDSWEWVDLSSLGQADSLLFKMTSSDIGEFGVNTPLYFAMDNFTTDAITSTKNLPDFKVEIFPNPSTDRVVVRWEEGLSGEARLLDYQGRTLATKTLQQQQVEFDVRSLSSGIYFLHLQTEQGRVVRKVAKL